MEKHLKKPTPRKKAWAIVRLLLGLAQMTGAVTSFWLLFETGFNALSIGAAITTTMLTLISRALFRGE
jgi:hypothetical protein